MADKNLGFYLDASHFASESHNFEVQRANHFEVVIDLSKLGLQGADILSDHIRMSTKSISAPKVNAEAIELKHGNDTVKVASAPSYSELSLTLYDTLGRDQLDVMQQWFDRVFDHKTKLMGLVSSYKTTATLYMYAPDCSIIRKWILQGVWPKSFGSATDFGYDSTEAQNVQVELSVDRYYEVTNT